MGGVGTTVQFAEQRDSPPPSPTQESKRTIFCHLLMQRRKCKRCLEERASKNSKTFLSSPFSAKMSRRRRRKKEIAEAVFNSIFPSFFSLLSSTHCPSALEEAGTLCKESPDLMKWEGEGEVMDVVILWGGGRRRCNCS